VTQFWSIFIECSCSTQICWSSLHFIALSSLSRRVHLCYWCKFGYCFYGLVWKLRTWFIFLSICRSDFAEFQTFVIWIAVLTVQPVVPHSDVGPGLTVAKLNTERVYKLAIQQFNWQNNLSIIIFLSYVIKCIFQIMQLGAIWQKTEIRRMTTSAMLCWSYQFYWILNPE